MISVCGVPKKNEEKYCFMVLFYVFLCGIMMEPSWSHGSFSNDVCNIYCLPCSMPVVFALDAGPMTTDPAIIESTWSILVTCIVTGRNWCKPPRSAIRGSLQEPKKRPFSSQWSSPCLDAWNIAVRVLDPRHEHVENRCPEAPAHGWVRWTETYWDHGLLGDILTSMDWHHSRAYLTASWSRQAMTSWYGLLIIMKPVVTMWPCHFVVPCVLQNSKSHKLRSSVPFGWVRVPMKASLLSISS